MTRMSITRLSFLETMGRLLWVVLTTALVLSTLLPSPAEGVTDYYKLLNIDRGANKRELKRAYRIKAVELHPDKNDAPDAEEMFVAVAAAYEVLSNEEERAKYDARLVYFEETGRDLYADEGRGHRPADRYEATMFARYRTRQRQTPIPAVIIGVLTVLSGLHWFMRSRNYASYREMAMERVVELKIQELSKARKNAKAKGGKRKKPKREVIEEQARMEAEEADIFVEGAEKPTFTDILLVRFFLLPRFFTNSIIYGLVYSSLGWKRPLQYAFSSTRAYNFAVDELLEVPLEKRATAIEYLGSRGYDISVLETPDEETME